MNHNTTCLGQFVELVLCWVLGARVGDARRAHVVIRTVETFVARANNLLVADVAVGIVDDNWVSRLKGTELMSSRMLAAVGEDAHAAHIIVRAIYALVSDAVNKPFANVAISIVLDKIICLGCRFQDRRSTTRGGNRAEGMLNNKEGLVYRFALLILDTCLAEVEVEAIHAFEPYTLNDLVAPVAPHTLVNSRGDG